MKYIDAKLTNINGEIHISWKTDDGNWQAEQTYEVPDIIAQDPVMLKNWVQSYKNSYNVGKDIEAADAAIPSVPSTVTALYNQPLNLS